MGFMSEEPTLEELEEAKQRQQLQLEIAQQKALEAEAKRRYGTDWKKFFSSTKSGVDWQALKFRIGE